MARNSIAGIDIGSFATKVVVADLSPKEPAKIIGGGTAESKGVRQGFVTNTEEVVRSLKKALVEAEKNSETKIRKVVLAVDGISLNSEVTGGTAIISRADKEVSDLDVARAISESEDVVSQVNKKIIHVIPLSYKLDNQEVLGRPEGMRGIKLEVKTLFVTCQQQHIDDLVEAVQKTGVEVIDIIASPLALALLALTNKERQAGCILIDIGAETTNVAVFENNSLQSLHVFGIGSADITKDIALGLKISLDEAESLKQGRVALDHPKKRLEDIIEARYEDIFELVEEYLEKIGRSRLLPAGAILTGGGASYPNIKEVAKRILKLPVDVATMKLDVNKKVLDQSLFVAAALALGSQANERFQKDTGLLKNIKKNVKSLIDQLLP